MHPISTLSRVVRPFPAWYRGDFHAHTTFSDGHDSPEQLIERARVNNLDFFAVTDHNTLDALPHFPEMPDLAVIPGMEVTLNVGHFNVLGIERMADWMEPLKRRGARDLPGLSTTALMKQTANKGLLNSINHPLLHPWAWLDVETELRYLHCLEVWNDPSWPDNATINPLTLEMWTDWLNDGYRITAIGGSDYHRPKPKAGQSKPSERLGVPSTYVFAPVLSPAAILDGLRRRRAYVSMGPRLSFHVLYEGTRYEIGDDLGEIQGVIQVEGAVSDCPPGARLQLIKRGEAILELTAEEEGITLRGRDQVTGRAPLWYRLDVRDPDNRIIAFSNPIYIGMDRPPTRLVFGEFLP